MKNITFLLAVLTLVSCSLSKEEQLISDHEQTLGNTKTDLNLKFVKVEFVKNITSKDSLEVFTKYFNEKKANKIEYFEDEIKRYEKEMVTNKKYLNQFGGSIWQEAIESNEEDIERNKKNIDLYNGDCKGTFLEGTLIKINNLEKNLDSVLSKQYDVIYTINNPMLKNVEQTISKTYFLNNDLTEILESQMKS